MLTDLACKSAIKRAVQGGKPSKHFDSKGLHLLCKPNGSALWRYKYRIHGKEKLLALGKYPLVGLSEAREKHQSAYKAVADGLDPSMLRQRQKKTDKLEAAATFEVMARQWHKRNLEKWCEFLARRILLWLEKDLFPSLGKVPVKDLTRRMLLDELQRIEARGGYSTAKRLLSYTVAILGDCVLRDLIPYNIAIDLKKALKSRKGGHYPSMEIEQLPDFLSKLYSVELSKNMRDAVELIMLTLVRRGELVRMQWSEVDFDKALWTIPATRMKMKREHLVPLSRQAMAILKRRREAQNQLVGLRGCRFVFPGAYDVTKPMCADLFCDALDKLGCKGLHSAHGFRSLGMGIAKEKLGYRHEIPDRQLAHAPAKAIDRAYDRAMFLPERTEMMQRLAAYIDSVNPHISSQSIEIAILKVQPTAPFQASYQVCLNFG